MDLFGVRECTYRRSTVILCRNIRATLRLLVSAILIVWPPPHASLTLTVTYLMSTPNTKPPNGPPPRNLLLLFTLSAVVVPLCFIGGTKLDAWVRGDKELLEAPAGPAAALPPSDNPRERQKRRTALIQEARALEEERLGLDQRLERVKERMAEKAARAAREPGQGQ